VLIDWFTVVAQIVNFLILVFLLKVFLYGRILNAMDAREERIASRLKEAERKRKEAEEEADSYQRKNEEIVARKKEFLDRARTEAEKEKENLVQKFREEADTLRARWKDSVLRDRDMFLQELKQRVGSQVTSIARRTLKELARSDLENQVVKVFLEKIRGLEENERKKMMAEVGGTREELVVQSAFELPGESRETITRTIRKTFGDRAGVKFQTSSDVILGIELKTDGRKIAWSVGDFLDAMENQVTEVLEEETREATQGKKEKGQDANPPSKTS